MLSLSGMLESVGGRWLGWKGEIDTSVDVEYGALHKLTALPTTARGEMFQFESFVASCLITIHRITVYQNDVPAPLVRKIWPPPPSILHTLLYPNRVTQHHFSSFHLEYIYTVPVTAMLDRHRHNPFSFRFPPEHYYILLLVKLPP